MTEHVQDGDPFALANPTLRVWLGRMRAAAQENEAAQAEQDAQEHQEALDALTDPIGILAQAYRAAQAAASPGEAERAQALTAVAQAAAAMLPMRPALGDDFWAAEAEAYEDEPARNDGPHALACRFTADVVGDGIGRIGGREMRLVRHVGWVDTTDADEVDVPDGAADADGVPGTRPGYRLTGRAVSRYNDQVLVITDGGVGMVLPYELVTLEADE